MSEKKGKRYVQDIELGLDQNFVVATMQEFIRAKDFKPVIEKNENYYKSGDGF